VSDALSVLERVRRIRGVSYAWREDVEGAPRVSGPPGTRELGVLAQEVEEVFPEAVRTDRDGLKSVDYLGLVAVLVEAVKELDGRLASVEGELAELRGSAAAGDPQRAR